MNDKFREVCQDYETNWERQMVDVHESLARGLIPERENLLMIVGRQTAELLHALIVGAGSRRVLDLGTSFGYSAVWLADAVRIGGGTVVSLDNSAAKQAYAKSQLERADLADYVNFVVGDAVQNIGALEGPFDFVLLDLFQEAYIPALNEVYPKLADCALIVADNMTFPEFAVAEAEKYRKHVRTLPGIEAVLLPIGYGIDLARFTRPSSG